MVSMQMSGYFDNAATTVMSQSALQTYVETARSYPANPSSSHSEGRRAAALLSQSRERVASLLKTESEHITFTAGATEANDIILSSLLWRPQSGQVVFSGIEHSSILQWNQLLAHLGWTVTTVAAPSGFIEPQQLAAALTAKTRLVSVMLVNNTVGTIQDIGAIRSAVRRFESESGQPPIHIHSDATQALGKIDVDLAHLGVDSASFSAHKFHGPRGVGILYNTKASTQSLSRGGGQERGLRAGTENLPAIAAMVTALEEAIGALEENRRTVTALNTLLRFRLRELPIITPEEQSSPYILTIAIPSLPSEVGERMLSDRGFSVSAGSACSHNVRQKGAMVHNAMRLDSRLAESSLRISLSPDNTTEECEALAEAILTIHRNHR